MSSMTGIRREGQSSPFGGKRLKQQHFPVCMRVRNSSISFQRRAKPFSLKAAELSATSLQFTLVLDKFLGQLAVGREPKPYVGNSAPSWAVSRMQRAFRSCLFSNGFIGRHLAVPPNCSAIRSGFNTKDLFENGYAPFNKQVYHSTQRKKGMALADLTQEKAHVCKRFGPA